MIINRKKLYDILTNQLKGEYVVGLHGIDYNRFENFYDFDKKDAVNSIIDYGLEVVGYRTIHGTVALFGRIDIEEDKDKVIDNLNTYNYGSNDYIIVAIPTILRTSSGKELYLGCPNLDCEFNKYIGTTGYQETTLFDEFILERTVNTQFVKPEFILGSFKTLGDGNIDLKFNKNHISFKNNYVDEEFYNKVEENVKLELFYSPKENGLNISVSDLENPESIDEERITGVVNKLKELIEIKKNYLESFDNRISEVTLYETLKQLLNEKNLTKVKPSTEVENSIESIEDNKEDNIDSVEENNRTYVYLDKGKFYNWSNEYFAKFKYCSDKDANDLIKFVESLIKYYGINSRRYSENQDDFLSGVIVDKNGNISSDMANAYAVSEINIPDFLIEDLVKSFVEYKKYVVCCEDLVMDGEFNQDIFDQMIEKLNNKDVSKKL